ncbi:hypothetical protein [Enterovirga rhinocerotis]|uniref:Uncharacterized protein n=1 Tax=Enterovirga rhinocerotis TaxID=1339210 RepID=A0A4R7C6V1_9HYPH|nr:hypothetical protein [Enterovirga rhinocerotis]TDR93991.1 hypothetical protein EV668_1260 [Enterovirga rhinocerotis]
MSDLHAGPLSQASPEDEHHAGPLAPAAKPSPARYKKSWREKRWERRRRRRFVEEVLGWVLVPVILIACYWAAKASLNAMGTNFTSLVEGIKLAMSGKI